MLLVYCLSRCHCISRLSFVYLFLIYFILALLCLFFFFLFIVLFFFFFFFSSRRRHTRRPRDWSSDVCSSDLAQMDSAVRGIRIREKGTEEADAPTKQERRKGHQHFRRIVPKAGRMVLVQPRQQCPKHNEIGRASCRERV